MPQDKNYPTKNQRPTAPRPDRKKTAANEIQKIAQAAARDRDRERLAAIEAHLRATITIEASAAVSIEIEPAHTKLKNALREDEFVLVSAPAAAESPNSTNRFGLFSAITSSIGYVTSCLNLFGKRS